MKHPVAGLCVVGAPWLVPMIGFGIFLHKHFLSCDTHPSDARVKAVARRGTVPKIHRRKQKQLAHAQAEEQQEDEHLDLLDVVGLGSDTNYEYFTEDEVEQLQQAQANPQALLDLLQQYGSRMVADGLLDELDHASEDSMWYTDDPHDSWQHDSPSSDRQQQHAQPDESSLQQQEAGQQAAGQDFLRRLAEAVQQRQQENPSSRPHAGSEASDADAAGAYFDDSYVGLPAEPSGAPQDLQELQAVVSKNLEALLPKDTTWTAGSYPPRFNERVTSHDDEGGYIGLDPEFDDLDPGFDFDYVPDFDFDPDFDDAMLDDMFDFDIEP